MRMITHHFLFPLLLVVVVAAAQQSMLDNRILDPDSPLETHWPEEEEIRARMSEYAKEKFAVDAQAVVVRNYSANSAWRKSQSSRRRRKRDGGVLSGPVSLAVLSGVIGMTSKALSDVVGYHPVHSDGGCKWFGTAPLCNHPCPSEYDYIRSHNGRSSNFWMAWVDTPDDSFGEPCSTILGGLFKKRFCCKSDPQECTWSGRWMGANTAHNAYCRYDHSVGRCGELSCSINHHDTKALDSSLIGGDRCNQLHMFNMTGYATCGFIAWMDADGELVNSWYKAGG